LSKVNIIEERLVQMQDYAVNFNNKKEGISQVSIRN